MCCGCATYGALRQDTALLGFTMPEWDAFTARARDGDGEFDVERLLLPARVEHVATPAAATAARTGSVTYELIAERRAEAVRELRARH
ncbi:MAG: hypothetical protein ACRDQW_03355 [Haloechinothrix sp.]